MIDIKYRLHPKWNQLYLISRPDDYSGVCFLIQVITRRFEDDIEINGYMNEEFVFRNYSHKSNIQYTRYDLTMNYKFEMNGIAGSRLFARREFNRWLEMYNLEEWKSPKDELVETPT